MTFIAGAYTVTYNAKALGQTADGIRMTYEVFKREITGDAGGDTVQDAVYRGARRGCSFRCMEANAAGLYDLLYPYSATAGNEWELGVIGLLDVRGQGGVSAAARAKQVVFTAVAGTSAANDGPATVTIPLAILAQRFPVEVLMAPDLREVPIRLDFYPNMSTGLWGSST